MLNDFFMITENSLTLTKTAFPCEYPVQFAVFVVFQPKLKPRYKAFVVKVICILKGIYTIFLLQRHSRKYVGEKGKWRG